MSRKGLVTEVKRLAEVWRCEADALERRHPQDPVVAVLRSCAGDLEAHCQAVLDDATPLTVKEYSNEHGVWPSTVRRWISRGELEAARNESGDYEIPRHARRLRQTTTTTKDGTGALTVRIAS